MPWPRVCPSPRAGGRIRYSRFRIAPRLGPAILSGVSTESRVTSLSRRVPGRLRHVISYGTSTALRAARPGARARPSDPGAAARPGSPGIAVRQPETHLQTVTAVTAAVRLAASWNMRSPSRKPPLGGRLRPGNETRRDTVSVRCTSRRFKDFKF
jgi:hypothetical protein